jgi:hypothetical protein
VLGRVVVPGDVKDPVLVPGDTKDPVLDGTVGGVVWGTEVVGMF